ncbi:MAG: M20 family metallo-hydrolase [Rhodothermales bacterium]|nr:M20 family metallo-hydrolase [Rhodothermales bacterium]
MKDLAGIGSPKDGGIWRLAFTDADLEARTFVEGCLRETGAEIRIDPLGNLFGIVETGRPGPVVMSGSHTDTVADGGRFDGSLGVMAAIEAADAISSGKGCGTFIAVDFVNEEGVRFMPDMMGSLFFTGRLEIGEVRSIRDAAGTSIGEELNRLGYAGTDSMSDLRPDFFIELHIEQGPILETTDHTIGVVTGVQGLKWFEITCSGTSNHAGTTPMQNRRDAVRAASRLMDHLHQLPDEMDGVRLTVGSVHARPNLINVIAERCVFTVDVRHPNPEVLSDAERHIRARVRAAEAESGCDISIRALADAEPVEFDRRVVEAVARTADESGFPARRMISGAGHDAQILNSVCPSGMIFIPSRGGISHSPDEFSTDDDLVAGANVLLGSILALMDG